MATKGEKKKLPLDDDQQGGLFGDLAPIKPKSPKKRKSTKAKQLKDGSVQLAFGFGFDPQPEAPLELIPSTPSSSSEPPAHEGSTQLTQAESEPKPKKKTQKKSQRKTKKDASPHLQPEPQVELEQVAEEVVELSEPEPQVELDQVAEEVVEPSEPEPQVELDQVAEEVVELSEPEPQVELEQVAEEVLEQVAEEGVEPHALAVIPAEYELSTSSSSEPEVIEVEWVDEDEPFLSEAPAEPPLKRLSPELVSEEEVQASERPRDDSTPPPSEYEIALVAERVERLFEEAQRYADASRSPQTKRAYQSDWRDFSEWCVEHHLHPLPCAPEYIALYLTDRASTLKISTLRRRLTAIRQVHKLRGHQLDTKHAAIQSVWGGIRREKGSMEQGKDPLRVELLRLIMLTRPRTLKGLRDRALILLGFTGAFRRSELVSLNRGDLEFLPQGLRVTLRKSKTDQEGQGMLKSILPGKHEETCCIRALQTWLQASQIQSGPIFRPINRHAQLRARRLTSHAVAVILKDSIRDALRAQGLPEHLIDERVASFSGHSLRAGYVTSAAAEGAEEHAIMRQTGHKRIDTLRRYIREGDLFRHNPLKSMDL